MKLRLSAAIIVLLFGLGFFVAMEFSRSITATRDAIVILDDASAINVPGEIRRHPDVEYLVRPSGVPFHEITAEHSALSESGQRQLNQLFSATEVASIGVFDGPEPFMLGEVAEVVLSGDRVYVLDPQSENVRVFSTTGAYLGTLGGRGQGPGELIRPNALTVLPGSSNVWVADETRRLSQYFFDDAAPRFVGVIEVGAGIQDVCFAAGTLVVHALVIGEGKPLQRLSTTGEVIASFGHPVYRSQSPSLNLVLNGNVRIECGEQDPLVFYGSTLGELRAYQADGQILWVAAITRFTWPDARELEDGRYAMLFQSHSSELVGLTALPDQTGESLLVQVSQLERQDAGWLEETRLDSYLLDPRTGEGSYVGSEVPLVVAAGPGMIVTLTNDGYPRIALLSTAGS